MKSELLSQEKNIVTIKVTVDQAGYAAQLKKTYAEIAKRVNIPGFRKGKAPKAVLEMRLGKDSIMSQALEDMLPKVLDEVCAEYDLEPIASPVVDDLDIKEGEDVTFTVKYEVEPEVTLPELSDITVDLPVFAVSESMVDEALENMKKRLATYRPVDRPAQHGDKVRAAYSLVVKDDDGKDIVSHEPQIDTFELDNLSMRPEIVEALTGTEAGTKNSADINVADDYRDKAVAGKTAHYEFDVIEVQEPVAPEMNDEFFRKVTSEDVHSEAELRATIRENLDKRLKADARTAAENEAVAKITEASQVELPDSMVRRQQEHLRKRFEENVKQRTKMSLEEYYKSEGHDLKELEENLEKDARRDVMGYLVVDACAKKFGVSVRKEDLDGEISQMAANYGISGDSIKDMLKKRPEDFENMISQARYRKTLQAIMEKVKVNEVKKGVDAEAPAAQN
ncbi:trigger factor [Pyramidobacter sp. YE332]|uniref:trigger factor n=1 Tax=Pyramidobacter sp. YE332 TaxID=3068894 RepID=UPI00294AD2C2|nr:trigger factor [Pyramidobacter sp. YE332]WOL38853.1 trigger factor [Pyramidobacter sp. YE332]